MATADATVAKLLCMRFCAFLPHLHMRMPSGTQILCGSNVVTQANGSYVLTGSVCSASTCGGNGSAYSCSCPAGASFSQGSCACLYPPPSPRRVYFRVRHSLHARPQLLSDFCTPFTTPSQPTTFAAATISLAAAAISYAAAAVSLAAAAVSVAAPAAVSIALCTASASFSPVASKASCLDTLLCGHGWGAHAGHYIRLPSQTPALMVPDGPPLSGPSAARPPATSHVRTS